MKPHFRNTRPTTQNHTRIKEVYVYEMLTHTLNKPKQPLPSSLVSLGCFGVETAIEDNGLLPFVEDLDLFAAPAIKSTNIKRLPK